MSGRLLGLDVGDRRIGIAVSDETQLIATPHSVYTRVGYGPDCRHIARLYGELGCVGVVSGLPLNMDGSAGFQAEKVRAFAAKLEEAPLRPRPARLPDDAGDPGRIGLERTRRGTRRRDGVLVVRVLDRHLGGRDSENHRPSDLVVCKRL